MDYATSPQSVYTPKNYDKPVIVLSSYNQAIISVAQTLLNEAGIKYSVRGSGIREVLNAGNTIEVFSGYTEILVTGDDKMIAARKILVDLEELDFKEKEFKVL